MSKMVCDICGTSYDDAAGSCPVCGWKPGDSLDTSADMDDILGDDFQLDDLDDDPAAVPPQKGKAVFDFDAVNTRRRQPAPAPASNPNPARPVKPTRSAPVEEDDEEEESGSNKFLVVVLVVLILALLAVSGYIAYTKLWKPSHTGAEDNNPQSNVSTEPTAWSDPNPAETIPSESTEATQPTIPCTGLSLVASMDKLTEPGQYWRLMVKKEPDNTTDPVTFTSGNVEVVTVDENGRVTAVGEGETVILITCGEQRVQTSAVVSFAPEPTVNTPAPAEGTSGTGTTGGSTVATPSSGVLKLKKTDITCPVRGVTITLELENGIAPESVKWSTTDSSIATVYNGNVTVLGRGTCIIRAEYQGQVAQCVVRCTFR